MAVEDNDTLIEGDFLAEDIFLLLLIGVWLMVEIHNGVTNQFRRVFKPSKLCQYYSIYTTS